ncbi:hypothetical protein C8J57DRAFT_58372 [Mycena rebaudengoi]|nr:hypothetical protein C8J57DRAFT_58372 [Mycena rebaudengoi]
MLTRHWMLCVSMVLLMSGRNRRRRVRGVVLAVLGAAYHDLCACSFPVGGLEVPVLCGRGGRMALRAKLELDERVNRSYVVCVARIVHEAAYDEST